MKNISAPLDEKARFEQMKVKLNSLNADSPPDSAVIISKENNIETRGNLDEFLRLTKQNSPAELTVLSYSEEGEPIFINLIYDGKTFYGAEDNSRVKNRGDDQEFFAYTHRFLKEYDNESSVTYYLTDDNSVTYDDIMRSALSSFSGDYIPHMFVMHFNK